MDSAMKPDVTKSGRSLSGADLERLAAQAEAGFDLSSQLHRPAALATLLHEARVGCFSNIDHHPEDGEFVCDADHAGAAARLSAASWSSPARLSVTVWDRPSGGLDVWLDALALDADGPNLDAAADALVIEIRALADAMAKDERFRRAPNWRRRGPFVAQLAMLDDAEIKRRFDFRFVGVGGDAGRHLDDSD